MWYDFATPTNSATILPLGFGCGNEKWIVFSCVEREAVWIVAANGSRVHRLVTGSQPDWSPDGLWIVFSARPPRGRSTLYAIHPDGSGLRRLTNGRTDEEQPDW